MSTNASFRRSIFVVMPFVETPTRGRDDLTAFFEDNIKVPIEAHPEFNHKYTVTRSGDAFNISDAIILDLESADIVICDLSGCRPNPNVMYELGIRLSVSDKPVILIREEHPSNERVFDIGGLYTFDYSPFRLRPVEQYLIGKITQFDSGQEKFASPVRRALDGVRCVTDRPTSAEAAKRFAGDGSRLDSETMAEVEAMYERATRTRGKAERIQALSALVREFPETNRAGCATLSLAHLVGGGQRERYLKEAIEKYHDCYYGDGVQVGPFARFKLAVHQKVKGDDAEAHKLFDEIRKEYPSAVDHDGNLLVERDEFA